jgi:hypothetical protein
MLLPTKLLTPKIADFVSTWLSAIPKRDRYPISTYIELLNHPKVAIAAELRMLFMLSLLRPYSHADEKITEEVLSAFAKMKGSWPATLLKMMQFLLYGFIYAEKVYSVEKGKAVLKQIQCLDQDLLILEGTIAGIQTANYSASTGEVKLPIENAIHIINQDYFVPGYDPYGIALCRRCVPYWELHKIILAAMTIAGHRQATPLLVGKTDTSAETLLYGSDGRPLLIEGQPVTINKGEAFRKDLEETENSSVVVIDRLDEILPVMQQTDGQFFRSVLYYLDSVLLWCFLISPVIAGTSESGVGDSSLIDGHLETLKTVSRPQMQIFGDELVEQLVRPMIEFNHGTLDSYGSFPVPQEETQNTVELLNAISSAVQRGAFSAEDISVINRAKQLAGIT